MKKNTSFSLSRSVFWGMVFVLAAVVLILDGVGVELGKGVTAWHYIGGVLLLAWLIKEIASLKFYRVFFPLAFLFMLFEGPIAGWIGREDPNIISNWTVLLAALLLTIGVKAISKKQGGALGVSGKSLGNSTLYFDANERDKCVVTDHLGNTQIYFINKENYDGAGVVSISDNLGNVTLHVPSEWNVLTEAKDNLGQISVPDREFLSDKSITLSIHDNLGRINVVFE